MGYKYNTGRLAVLGLLQEDGGAWTLTEIHDWLCRNPDFGPHLAYLSVKTHIHTAISAKLVVAIREVGQEVRYKYNTEAP